ncbi:MAG TPA: thylakoid membrane photosystem I accumulation factor [Prochlorococcus sp.]|nr:thylakoid membrane photosystem I accumulation factor [Prochlorococcus sp.]
MRIKHLRVLPMTHLLKALLSLGLTILLMVSPAHAIRDDDNYDGNIFPIYAGNGSLGYGQGPSLSESLRQKRTSVLVFYLDDSAVSKAYSPVVSAIQLIWGNAIDLILNTTDEFQGRTSNDPQEASYYWHGRIPQVVVIDGQGEILLDQEGQVSLDEINDVISATTGLSKPTDSLKIDSFNEYNSFVVKE